MKHPAVLTISAIAALGVLAGSCALFEESFASPEQTRAAALDSTRATLSDGSMSLAAEPVDAAAMGRGLIAMRVHLRNETDEPRPFTMPSGQMFDLVVEDARGETVRRWSDDKMFTMALVDMELEPRRSIIHVLDVPITGLVPESTYNIVATFTPTGDTQPLRTVPYEVRVSAPGD